MWSFPDDVDERAEIDAWSQTPDSHGRVLCWRRRLRCNNPDCEDPLTGKPHRFSADERELWNCPICDKDRHCHQFVTLPNRGCHYHGGKSPRGYDHPSTKTGEFSKYIQEPNLRADYESMLTNSKLLDLEDHIALLYALLKEKVGNLNGGASRELLKQMKANRSAYDEEKLADEPDVKEMRRLDNELNDLIDNGAEQYQVRGEYLDAVTNIANLIAKRDAHVQMERQMITSDRAWAMLATIQETFAVGLEMLAEFNDDDLRFVLDAVRAFSNEISTAPALPLNSSVSKEQHERNVRTDAIITLKGKFRDHNEVKKKKALAYASKRFQDLAGDSTT